MVPYLRDNYNLYCYNSKRFIVSDELKLLGMMGSTLMITMFENSEIQIREINTAGKFNIPILFI